MYKVWEVCCTMTPEEKYYGYMRKIIGDFMIKKIINPLLVKNGINPETADVKVEWKNDS